MTNNPPEPMKLSPAMREALRSFYEGRPWHHIHGRAQSGGASGTAWALIQRGLIDTNDQLTEDGRDQAALLFSKI